MPSFSFRMLIIMEYSGMPIAVSWRRISRMRSRTCVSRSASHFLRWSEFGKLKGSFSRSAKDSGAFGITWKRTISVCCDGNYASQVIDKPLRVFRAIDSDKHLTASAFHSSPFKGGATAKLAISLSFNRKGELGPVPPDY